MQIVIDIDENVFTRLFDNGIEDYAIVNDDLFAIAKSIRKCTPLQNGHWIPTDNYFSWRLNYVECSCCHKHSLEEGDYCSNCGAKMEVNADADSDCMD